LKVDDDDDDDYDESKCNVIIVINYAIKYYAMKALGNGSIAPLFLTTALDGGELLASRPCRFTFEDTFSGTLSGIEPLSPNQ
jgi:hypothetical protein